MRFPIPRHLFLECTAFLLSLTVSSQTTYYSKSTGNLNLTSTWGTNTNGSGSSPANFTSAGCTYVITNTTAATIGAAWTVSGLGSKVQVGDGSLGTEFTVPAAFAFSGTYDVTNSSTITLLHTTSPVPGNLSSGSTVNYARAGAQTVPDATYFNLVLGGNGQKSLAGTANSTVTNSLIIGTGVTFRLHTVTTLSTTLSGTISGAGAILGNASSILDISGTGDFGTLTFSTTLSLYQLHLNRAASGVITLGSNLTVSNAFVHNSGLLSLNGTSLTLNGQVTFPSSPANGSMVGSTTSSLAIGASLSGITNAMCFDQGTTASSSLGRFTFNRTLNTLTLGSELNVMNAFTHSNGTIDLNGKSLSIGGLLTFPALITNGAFIGSPTSSLSIVGTGAETNSLKFSQGTASAKTLGAFTVDHTGGTTTLGTNITCEGPFIHSNGPLALGGTSLQLSGPVTFPASAVNGSLIGSAASALVVDSAGTITNSLFMSQASAAARTLNSLLVDRSGGSLALGNALIVNSFDHRRGIVDLNGSSLSLNGSITFALAAKGGIRGSSTSTLLINTSLLGMTNPLAMDQSSAASKSLSRFTINRTAQTLSLGGDLVVNDAYTQTNGIIVLNGFLLSASGTVVFPSTVVNGYLTGSPSSSLTIAGTGIITNPLRLDALSAGGTTLSQLLVDHSGGILTLGTGVTCNDSFSLTNGTITLGANQLALNGAITWPFSASNGSITGSATSSITVGGSGPITNAMYMSQATTAARTLGLLAINRAGQAFAIGNPLIAAIFQHTSGTVDLNNTSLTLSGAITFPTTSSNGQFKGSTTSTLNISSSAAIVTNPLFFSQADANARSLAAFTFARTGQTLALGSGLAVTNLFTQSVGVIDINGQSLELHGTMTFPSTLANGSFIGSTSSSLSIAGSGAITNALRFSQNTSGTRSLHTFSLDFTGSSLVMGNSLNCEHAFVHNNGNLSVGTSSLVLNGTISFPASAANGSITGSAASTLHITGNGAITNSLFMAQATAAARTFNQLVVDRTGQVLTLGNPLVVNTLLHTNGQVGLGGTSLNLNNAVTFPANITNGSFIGSTTATLSITGSGAITNSLKLDQTNQGTRSLSSLTMNRAAQSLTLGNAIEIRNALTPTSGSVIAGNNVTLKADAARSGMLGTVSGFISGSLTVESFAPGGFTGWTNIGPAGVTSQSVSSWENQIPMTCLSCPNNEYSAGGSYFVSIQSFNETASGAAAYVPLSYTSPLTRGTGYWVYMGTGASTTSAITFSVNGPVVTGNVVIPVTRSNNLGFNLVADPYAAPIDWDLVAADAANSNISSSVYFFNPDLAQTVSYAGGISSPSGYISNGIIPMGQAFYVEALTGTSITFRESHKSTENTSANPLLRSKSETGTVLRLSIAGPDLDFDETAIRFHQDASFAYDHALDAHKIFQTPGYPGYGSTYSVYTTISTQLNDEDYSINSLPRSWNGQLAIPVLARARATAHYTIAATGIEELPSEMCIALYDKVSGTTHDLRNGSYVCKIADTTNTPRFELRICSGEVTDIANTVEVSQSPLIAEENGRVTVSMRDHLPAVITAFNMSGQKIHSDVDAGQGKEQVHLDLQRYSGQVVLVTIQGAKGTASSKVLLH